MDATLIIEMTPEQQEQVAAELQRTEDELREMLGSVAQDIQQKFSERSSRRQVKEREWIESTRLYLGSLSSDRGTRSGLRTISSNPNDAQTSSRSMPDHNLVKSKCDIAVAQGISLQFGGGDKNWDLKPTAVPEIDPEQALPIAKAMEREIEDQLEETKYGMKSRQVYQDRVVLGTGILKGPLPSREAQLTYEIQEAGGQLVTIPRYRVLNRPVLFRVDPWLFFPDDTVNCIDDAADAIELHPMSKVQLLRLKKNPGFNADAIDRLCKLQPEEHSASTFTEMASLTDSGKNYLKGKYAVLEYHGPVSVDLLGKLGIEPGYDPLGDNYFGEIWVCQGEVLRVELETIEGAFELPYAVSTWLPDPGSIFGFGLPQSIKDPQRMATAAVQMILENSSISSGPMLFINKNYFEPFDGVWELGAHKMFGTTDYALDSVEKAIKQVEVRNVTDKIFPVLQFAREIAQEESGLPALVGAGLQSPQTSTDSATGMAIQQHQSTTVSDWYAEMWDDQITEKIIRRMFHWNMQYNPKPEIVGDFDIDVRSSTEYRNKQLYIRDIEKLSVEAAQNPELQMVLNMDELQRVRLSMMHIPSGTIVKSPEQVKQAREEAQQNQQPDPNMLKAQAEMAKVEVEKERIALEREKLQMEYQLQQRREEMDHAERLGSTAVRQQEAQARVIESENQREIEMIKLAQRSEGDRVKILADLEKENMRAETNKFLEGMNTNVKLRQQAMDAAELSFKARTGLPGI